MTRRKNDGYLEEIQERMDGDVFRAMIEVVAQRVMEEELALHLGAERHERTEERKGHRNGYKARSLKTRVGELTQRGVVGPHTRRTLVDHRLAGLRPQIFYPFPDLLIRQVGVAV